MKTHPLNVSYLVVGLAFIGISVSWALRAADVIASADLEWILPLCLVLAGAIGLVAFVAGGRSRRTPGEPPADPYADAYADPYTDTYTDTSAAPEGDPR